MGQWSLIQLHTTLCKRVAHRCGVFSSFIRVPHSERLFLKNLCANYGSDAVLDQVSVEKPSSWRQLPELGDVYSEEAEVGSRIVTFETGKLARFAAGSVVVGIKETKVLSTVVSLEGDGARDFLPLTVDYREKQYAQGKIPNTFMRREGAPKERELLCARVTDRSIRPLFPKGFYHEVQVIANVLSSDGEQDPDVMAANASSAALMISDIPWNGPVGVVRIGRIDGKFVVNPDMDELSISDLNLIYSCTRDKALMIETQAREITNADLTKALHLAHTEATKLIDPQIRLAEKVKNQKKRFKLFTIMDSTLDKIKKLAEPSLEKVFADPTYGKFERGKALNKITDDVRKVLENEGDEETLKLLPKAVDTVRKMVVRKRIFEDGLRVDGRRLDEVRPVYCESGSYPALHGSSIFSRGNTQVFCTITLGAPGDAQRLDSLVGPPTKRFMLHYSFPPFSINEIGKQGGLNRREVGHGTLAEKALLALLPPEEEFPYSVRVNSEVMASDGSTSMASVCAGSMALMDAGVPLREHVAGVSVGLITDVDLSSGAIKDYRILTDILGLEDHLGDMDFKIAGTRKGVTAIQLDIKPDGIPLHILCESLEPALKARCHILDQMEKEINEARSGNSPRVATLKFNKDSLWRLIGPQGSQIKKIEAETGARIAVNSEGIVTVLAKSPSVMEKSLEKINFIAGREIEVGGMYKGIVVSIKEYGAFVEFNGGQQGLLHISELSHHHVSRVSDVVSEGQELSVMCIGQDVRGNIKLSLKATLPKRSSTLSASQDMYVEASEVPFLMDAGIGLTTEKTNVERREMQNSSICESSPAGDEDESQDVLLPPTVIIRNEDDCKQLDAASCSISNKQDKKSKTSKLNLRTEKNEGEVKATVSLAAKMSDFEQQYSRKCERVSLSSLVEDSSKMKKHGIISGDVTAQGSSAHGKVHSPSSTEIVDAASLKIGDEVTAKVHQIRLHGLDLQLGGGIKGIYRFQESAKRDFEIGEELVVQCSSFNSKGIPIFLLKNNHTR